MKIKISDLRRIIAEEVSLAKMGDEDSQRFLHGSESGHPVDDEGSMAKSKLVSMIDMATDLHTTLGDEDQLPGWVQDHISVAHENLQQVHGYITNSPQGNLSMPMPLAQDVSGDSIKLDMLESRRQRAKNSLREAHARITQEEIEAWRNGDWGFVSEEDD